jgi:hypothetical protein
MTMISEMLLKGEASAGSTISIDAMDDKKCLKYEVVKDVAGSPLVMVAVIWSWPLPLRILKTSGLRRLAHLVCHFEG